MQQQSTAAAELQHILTIPPSDFQGATTNPAAVAHASLQALRDSGDERYLFLRTILELTHPNQQQNLPRHEELLFHCVAGCRHVILHKWNKSSGTFRNTVRDFLMSLGKQLSSQSQQHLMLPRTVRVACYTTSASFWKRQWDDGTNDILTSSNNSTTAEEKSLVDAMAQQVPNMPRLETKNELFHYVESLLLQQPSSLLSDSTNSQCNRIITEAATFLSVLVGEFSGKSAVQYNLPLEFHKNAHALYEGVSIPGSSTQEGHWLDKSLQLSMGALSNIVSIIVNSSEQQQNDGGGRMAIDEEMALAVVQVTIDVISWEFGTDAWDAGMPSTSGKTLLRPPPSWKDVLIRPDFVGAIFRVHEITTTVAQSQKIQKLSQCIRQLLLLLASLSGPIFSDDKQRLSYATYVVEGTLKLLSTASAKVQQNDESSELIDVLSLVSRLIANFKLSILVQMSNILIPLLNGMTHTGTSLLQANAVECERVRGDIDSMENGEYREECWTILLDGAVLLTNDPWLLYSGTAGSRMAAQTALSNSLAPLYTSYLQCRIRMAKLEEHYIATNEEELEETLEEISALNLEEEMASAASIGRLNLLASLSCISSMLKPVVGQLEALWNDSSSTSSTSAITPDQAALLEEGRLLTMLVTNILTDDNEGETPIIPETIIVGCDKNEEATNAITSTIQLLLTTAELQASKIAANPNDIRLSPLLAKSFLDFLNRWAPAFVLPLDYGSLNKDLHSLILHVWSSTESAQSVISFCITLCLHYQSYWPLERQVQDGAYELLMALAKRGSQTRKLMILSPSFQQLIQLHSLTAGVRHSAPPSELQAAVQAKGSSASGLPPTNMIQGYQRLPYDVKSRILTALIVACSDYGEKTSDAMLNECLTSVQTAFSSLVQALTANQIAPDDVNAKEMACLCVEMYGGIARASEMIEPERIPHFMTPSLPHLSGLMTYYAKDLTICESLLRLFRDYAEQFIAMLNRNQCLALFNASAELLRAYSSNHCTSRVVARTKSTVEVDAEEEQNYTDVLSAIQLLIHLGTKDFIDVCSSTGEASGIDSSQVTDVIFFGLQQILPLMTQGLLQFPTLCTQYFSLVGFMMDTYPEKVCSLPYELFDALLESLLFGMSHVDNFVSKSSLQGIAGVSREHLKTNCLNVHLQSHPDIFDKCSKRLLHDVVFQSIVWDRIEPSGMALLPLAAVDIQRFVTVVNTLAQQVNNHDHQVRLQNAFQILIQPEVLSKISSGGYEGRMNRLKFKKDFETFVKDIHSFLVMK